MQRLDLVLRELQPLLKTLDNKSNALIIQDAATDDPVPVGAKREMKNNPIFRHFKWLIQPLQFIKHSHLYLPKETGYQVLRLLL